MSSVYSSPPGQNPSNSLNYCLHFEEIELRHGERHPKKVCSAQKAYEEAVRSQALKVFPIQLQGLKDLLLWHKAEKQFWLLEQALLFKL